MVANGSGSSDVDILVIEDVARLLHCSVDTLRRVPKEELPAYRGPGRKHLYLREDIIRFVRCRRITGPDIDNLLREIETAVVHSELDSVRGRSSARRTS